MAYYQGVEKVAWGGGNTIFIFKCNKLSTQPYYSFIFFNRKRKTENRKRYKGARTALAMDMAYRKIPYLGMWE